MNNYNIKKGLDLPISGEAKGSVETKITKRVGVLGQEYNGMKPSMLVKVGDKVKKGQKLFEDKKNPGVFFTSPASGAVLEIKSGDRRSLLSVIIGKDDKNDAISFGSHSDIPSISKVDIVDKLIESGSWVSFRTRPFSKIPKINSSPNSIFVTAMDTNPLSIDPEMVITDRAEEFKIGLDIISKLTNGKLFVCKKQGANIPSVESAELVEFSGVHPAGLAGTHIHMLDPVNLDKTVWHINYQEVIAIGSLFINGEIDSTRVISVAGPAAKTPKFIKTELGADINEIILEQGVESGKRLADNKEIFVRTVNGSVLSGYKVIDGTEFLGRYSLQISLLDEGYKKEFMGWAVPGFNKFSATKSFISSLLPNKLFDLTTSSNGSPRAIVPIGLYEKVMPLDILPGLLLKSIVVKDTDEAQRLGVLELDEEDLALCTFVCPGKYEYGAILRENLEQIERDG